MPDQSTEDRVASAMYLARRMVEDIRHHGARVRNRGRAVAILDAAAGLQNVLNDLRPILLQLLREAAQDDATTNALTRHTQSQREVIDELQRQLAEAGRYRLKADRP